GTRTSVSPQSAAGAAWTPLRNTRASWLRLIRKTKLPDGTSGKSNSRRSQRLVVLIGGGILLVRGNASGEPRGAGEVLQAAAAKFRDVHSGPGASQVNGQGGGSGDQAGTRAFNEGLAAAAANASAVKASVGFKKSASRSRAVSPSAAPRRRRMIPRFLREIGTRQCCSPHSFCASAT